MAQALDRIPEQISLKADKIKALAPKIGSKEIGSTGRQASLIPIIENDVGGIGMGVLSDGTPYLNQRGLAAVCGVQNAHIGTISTQWAEIEQKPRITAVKAVLAKAGFAAPPAPHIQISYRGRVHYCYPADVCLAILEYYAFDAGGNCTTEARDNFRLLAGSKLREMIYSQVGYDPTRRIADPFKNWHDRVALNHQSAPKGFFCVFNEAHTIFYELIQAGADIGRSVIVDISIGQHWSKHWTETDMEATHEKRHRFPHRYPDSHPQARSNPQDSWCYPVSALGAYRAWLQEDYIEGGKFSTYLSGKVARRELPPSVAQLAIAAMVPPQITGPQP
jgi:hypothetical protein